MSYPDEMHEHEVAAAKDALTDDNPSEPHKPGWCTTALLGKLCECGNPGGRHGYSDGLCPGESPLDEAPGTYFKPAHSGATP